MPGLCRALFRWALEAGLPAHSASVSAQRLAGSSGTVTLPYESKLSNIGIGVCWDWPEQLWPR